MEIVKAQNNEADFQGFLKLEKEFSELYTELHVGEQYGRMHFEEEPLTDHQKEFSEHMKEVA